jgi:hypothetical protein
MACVLPFRPWSYPGLRVFGFRTTGDLSTNPPQVLSCTCAPPQWRTLPRVASRWRLGRPCLVGEAPRIGPRPFSMIERDSPLFAPFLTGRSNGDAAPPERAAFRVWLPSWRFQPSRSREPVSVPHAHGLRSSGLMSDHVAGLRFSENLPLRRFSAKPHGLAPTLQRLTPTGPAALSARPIFRVGIELLALLSFCTSQVFFRRIFEEVSSLFVPFPLFFFRSPKKPEAGAPRVSFQRPGISPLSRGADLLGVSGRLSSPAPLEREPSAAYFFSSGFPDSLRPPKSPSERPAPPRLPGYGTAFRPH